MTTFTPHADASPPGRPAAPPAPRLLRRGARRSAFTLTEVIISATLSTFILAGILSTFLIIGRTGLNTSAYVEMNGSLRLAVERFDQDVRLATDLRWHDERSLTLLFPADLGPAVTYRFEPAADPAAPGRFVRQRSGGSVEVLVREVAPDFAFGRYRMPDASGADRPATGDLDTKLLEVRLRAVRSSASAPSASQLAVSARCVLRNKNHGV